MLNTEQKHFNPEVKLRALFGSDVLLDAKEQQLDIRRQTRSRQRKHMRRTILSKPADTWPVAGMGRTGLHMECRHDINSGLPPEYLVFEYACSLFCSRTKIVRYISQDQYLARSSTTDPATVSELLRHHPFHDDTLLQMSQVFCFHGEFVQAADFVTRVIFALECDFHSVLNAHYRIDHSSEKNRSFYIALFRHIQLLRR
jgi:Transcriptional repressor TCF25